MLASIFRWLVQAWCLGCIGALTLKAESAAPPPASTQPALSDRQASILLQLADAEANIKVINQALVRTGYRVGLAYDRIENSEKANELMDRKGGGPMRWDEFYGRTARDFYAPKNAGTLHAQGIGAGVDVEVATGYRPLQRPPQFDYIYRANDQQIVKAREQIASLLQNQSALLARRQKHEADQSALWAELAWERVRDEEIAFRPTYRFALKGDAARVGLLRGPILFLRVANQAVVDGLDSIESDQPGTFGDLRTRTKAAYAALQETMSTALIAPDVSALDSKEASELKADCKQIAEECLVIDDNCRKADESDRANEDVSKLEYRSQLQSSLAKLPGLIGGLDDQVSKVVASWGIAPQPGVDTPDQLPPFHHVAAPRPSPPNEAPPQVASNGPSSVGMPPDASDKPHVVGPENGGEIRPSEWRVWCWSGSTWDEYALDKMDVRFADGVLRATNTTGSRWGRAILVWRGALLEGDFSISFDYRGPIESFDIQSAAGQDKRVTAIRLPRGDQWQSATLQREGEHVSSTVGGLAVPIEASHTGTRLTGYFCFKLRPGTTVEVRNLKLARQLPKASWHPADGKWLRRWTGKGSELSSGLVVQTYDVFGDGTRVKAYSWNLPLVRERDGSLSIEGSHFFQVFTNTDRGITVQQWSKRSDYDTGQQPVYDGVFEPKG